MWSLQHIELYRESRELTHTLLQCMTALATDRGCASITPLLNRSSRSVESFLAASTDAHRLWSEALTSPFRLHGVERAAFDVSRRPVEMVFPQHDARLESLHSLLLSFVLGAQNAARADPRLCVLFYGLSLSEARAIRSLSAASVVQLATRLKVEVDEPQARRLQQALPAAGTNMGLFQARHLAMAIAGCGPDDGSARAADPTPATGPGGVCPHSIASNAPSGKKVRVRSDEIRRCLMSPEDALHVDALTHLHQKGLKRPALHSLRGITKAALILSGVGVKIPRSDRRLKLTDGGGVMRALEWRKRTFAQHALLLIQIYRTLDPSARLELGVDPWAFGVASDLLGSISRRHPLTMYQEDQILRAYTAGIVDTVACPLHHLDYLVPSDESDLVINSACPRCDLARGEGVDLDDYEWATHTEADMAASA